MQDAYYGPTPDARVTINRLLALPAKGDEQDWEIELADPGKLDPMFELLGAGSLDLEERSAVALLLTHTVDELAVFNNATADMVARLRAQLGADAKVLGRMRFHWSRKEASEAIQEALG